MSETPETEPTGSVHPSRAPGEILKQAREARSLSVAAIATQLNLDLRMIEALERGEQNKLPAPIFVRGYLRGYARLVGVPEDQVLGAYQAQVPQQEPAPRAVGMSSAPLRPAFRASVIPWRGLLLTGVLIAAVTLVFVYGPRLVTPFLVDGIPEADPERGLPLPMPGGEEGTSAGEPGSPAMTPDGLELPLPEPQPVPAEEPPPPVDAEPEPSLPSESDFGPATERAPTVMVTAAPAIPAQVQLEFRFEDDSWVEVRGADRARLLIGLMRKGDTRSVSGKPPVSVLLGNSAAVELRVDGELFEHARYNRGNVARFEVGKNS